MKSRSARNTTASVPPVLVFLDTPRSAWKRKTRTGGTLAVVFRADRLFTTDRLSTKNPNWTEGLAAEWTQPLMRGAGDAATADLRRAANGVRAANGAYAAAIDDVLLRIETAYWELAYATDQVAARRKAEEVASGLLDVTEARVDAKVASSLDLAEARAGLESRRGDVAAAEGVRGRAADALRALILPFDRGETADVDWIAVDDPRTPRPLEVVSPDEARYVRTALARRPDLLAIDAELENRGIDVRVAENDLLPQVDLFARLGADGLDRGVGTALGEMVTGQAVTAEVGLTFSTTFGRRTARARLRIAEWTCRQAGVRRREAVNRIVEEVRATVRDAATAPRAARLRDRRDRVRVGEPRGRADEAAKRGEHAVPRAPTRGGTDAGGHARGTRGGRRSNRRGAALESHRHARRDARRDAPFDPIVAATAWLLDERVERGRVPALREDAVDDGEEVLPRGASVWMRSRRRLAHREPAQVEARELPHLERRRVLASQRVPSR